MSLLNIETFYYKYFNELKRVLFIKGFLVIKYEKTIIKNDDLIGFIISNKDF